MIGLKSRKGLFSLHPLSHQHVATISSLNSGTARAGQIQDYPTAALRFPQVHLLHHMSTKSQARLDVRPC